jgi:hypothetical protein
MPECEPVGHQQPQSVSAGKDFRITGSIPRAQAFPAVGFFEPEGMRLARPGCNIKFLFKIIYYRISYYPGNKWRYSAICLQPNLSVYGANSPNRARFFARLHGHSHGNGRRSDPPTFREAEE